MTGRVPDALLVALEVVDALDAMRIDYHVGGSYASSIHGVPRQTQDVDLVVDLTPEQVEPLAARLKGFYLDSEAARRAVHQLDSFNAIHHGTGIKVDFFVRGDTAFDQEELRRSKSIPIGDAPGRRIRVKTAEDTLLRKLQWYRDGGEVSERQWGDIRGIVRIQGDRLDGEYLRKWSEVLGVSALLERALQE